MRTFFNEDWVHFLWTRFESGNDIGYDDLVGFIKQYEGSSVTDFCLNINGTVSSSLSDIFETWSDKFKKTEENGLGVDYKNTFAKLHYQITQEKKLDMYGIWVDQLKKIGINPWLSFRMNDCHGNIESGSEFMRAEYVNEHPELWICGNREPSIYFDKCLNYLLPEVQNRMFGYIFEQLERYDVYGIELDFMREAFCVPSGLEESWRAALIEFMKRVKQLVNEFSQKRGKEIKICIICQANPISAYNNGFDMAELAGLNLVDFVVAAPRWETINCDIPIPIWKKLLNGKAEVGAMQQLLVSCDRSGKAIMSNIDMAFGQAAAFSSQGADFIYLYNYFDTIEAGLKDFYHNTSIREQNNIHYILNNIGKIEDIEKYTRRCPLTFDDAVCLFDEINSKLPFEVKNIAYPKLRFVTGSIKENQKAYLVLGFKDAINPEKMRVYANNLPAQYCSVSKADKNILPVNDYAFEITPWIGNTVVAEIISSEGGTICYAEILIKKKF